MTGGVSKRCLEPALRWFRDRGYEPLDFQLDAWTAFLDGESGLIHAPTGFGKSLAAFVGPLVGTALDHRPASNARGRSKAPPLSVLWITPMRALARTLHQNLQEIAADLRPDWTVEVRTGDSSSAERARQKRRLPTVLITTPESASLLMSYADVQERFRSLQAIVVDEWHELLGTKRGTQVELLLSRLRGFAPSVQTFGLSATVGDLGLAMRTLLGVGGEGRLIQSRQRRDFDFELLVPDEVERFPWAGHLGLQQLEEVAALLDQARSTILFVNTRSQAERWYQALRYIRYERRTEIALHHGSLDRQDRHATEGSLGTGGIWAIVATSSLDLGVDFSPVDQVIQIGSPRGVARLVQRAGRSGHGPGQRSRVVGVPTHSLELLEFHAARSAWLEERIETRCPLIGPLDVLVQHLVTAALGGGFTADELLSEVRSTVAFEHLTDQEWRWAIEFCTFGGPSLKAYERYARIRCVDGRYVGQSERNARDHRLSIGTITGYGSIPVVMRNGSPLGTIEELFLARLAPGEAFTFGGRNLELVRFDRDRAVVRPARRKAGAVARWAGGRLPFSGELAALLRELLGEIAAVEGATASLPPRLGVLDETLAIQAERSAIPGLGECLIERTRTREGHFAFVFPIAGRLVHDGLGALVAGRIAERQEITIATVCNDWGFALLSRDPLPDTACEWRSLLSPERAREDLERSFDLSQLMRRHFREVARVSGLVASGPPHRPKSQRQVQESAGLIHDVLAEYDPSNPLLGQCRVEVLERSFQLSRLVATLERIGGSELLVRHPRRLTPFAFPLWVDRTREQFSSESWETRVQAMLESLESAEPRQGALE